MKLPVVIAERARPYSWPYPEWDCEAEGRKFFNQLQAAFPEVEFVFELAKTIEDADALNEKYPDAVGFIVYFTTLWSQVSTRLLDLGRRVLMVDDPYAGSGGVLVFYGVGQDRQQRVAAVASTNFEDVKRGVGTLIALARMHESRILVYTERDLTAESELLAKDWGVELIKASAEDYNAALERVDEAEAQKVAQRWTQEAELIVEPTSEDILKGAKAYLALKAEMARLQADAVTVDCLTLIYSGKTDAYPCLAFMQLNSEGSIGVCEADLTSTLVFLFFKYLANRPGYVSDPVVDEGADQVIYAHCVATIKPFGPDGPQVRYHIRSHTEDDKGAAVQSFLPEGHAVTTTQFVAGAKTITMHNAFTVGNVVMKKACRTKLACSAPAHKLLNNWRFGWHRVTVYGDYRREVEYLARLQGYRLLEEDV